HIELPNGNISNCRFCGNISSLRQQTYRQKTPSDEGVFYYYSVGNADTLTRRKAHIELPNGNISNCRFCGNISSLRQQTYRQKTPSSREFFITIPSAQPTP
ncbi:MAG: hypothetical protein IJE90_07110, partial [Clostridia bacterium]|nr:hypothetical protein [Clostridia bacterium]